MENDRCTQKKTARSQVTPDFPKSPIGAATIDLPESTTATFPIKYQRGESNP